MTQRNSIYEHVNFDSFLSDKNASQETNENYNDLFSTLESDIEISNDPVEVYDEEQMHDDHSHSENIDPVFTPDDGKTQKIMVDENILNQKKHIIISLNNKTISNAQKDIHSEATIQKINNLIDNTASTELTTDTAIPLDSDIFVNTHHYILPIADAFERNNDKLEKNNREVLKRNIANLYEKRKKMTLAIRKIQTALTKDITSLKTTLKLLGIPISEKILNLKTDIRAAKILKEFKLTDEELGWRYPELALGLQEIYRLRILASFAPINDPVFNARRSSSFGYRTDPFTRKARMHAGLDFAARTGTPLLASGVGIIKFAGAKSGYGNSIDVYHGNGIVTRYAHLSRIFVKKGQRVAIGQKIGAVGSTGRSTGAHLHYEIRINNKPTNPVIFLNKKNYINGIFNNY